jgi:propionyl-CoA synthetase
MPAITPTGAEPHPQAQVQQASLQNPEHYWDHFASELHWDTPYSKVLTFHDALPSSGLNYTWFKDGMLNTCYNAVDRHVRAGRGKQVAIYYDSPANNEKRPITYLELLEEVQICAGVIASRGVKKGDMVLIYSKLSMLW